MVHVLDFCDLSLMMRYNEVGRVCVSRDFDNWI
jgi:hypothetical protein